MKRAVPLEAVDLIKSFEGLPDGDPRTVNLDPYLDPVGIWTIGWGHAIADVMGRHLKGPAGRAEARARYPRGITRADAEALLRADLRPRAADVARLVKVQLTDAQFGALVSLVFNIGVGNLASSTLLKLLNAGDYAGAAEQFLVWNKGRVGGKLVALRGLTRRRKAERAMFLGLEWQEVASA